MKTVKRGYVPEDEKFFSDKSMTILKKASDDIRYLINNGYQIKNASVFVGNHYNLSERQRLALVRSVSSQEQLSKRKRNKIEVLENDSVVYIDGFNTIITLEVAFSDSPIFLCMDNTVRDLAGLRGTYRIIDKTESAVIAIGKTLKKHNIKKAVFYLDAPVSNSGRLGQKIKDSLSDYPFETEIIVINEVDHELKKLENVISSDAIILDNCKSWYNLVYEILKEENLLKNTYKVW